MRRPQPTIGGFEEGGRDHKSENGAEEGSLEAGKNKEQILL